MPEYEYKVIAAPTRGVKTKGLKSAEDRFSHALELRINEMAISGWEYIRAEALPSVERSGLTSTKTTWHNVLVFRRAKRVAAQILAAPEVPAPAARAAAEIAPKTAAPETATPEDALPEDQPQASDQVPEVAPDTEAASTERPVKPLIAER
jgi:hypothetical protein